MSGERSGSKARANRVLRIVGHTHVLLNITGALETVLAALGNPHPNPLPEGEGT